jgi:hypothetical protein
MRCLALNTLPQKALAAVLRQTVPTERPGVSPPPTPAAGQELSVLGTAHSECSRLETRGSDAPDHSPATGPMLTSSDSAWCLSVIAKATPWAPPPCPHPSGSKDQAGLLTQSLLPLGRRALGGRPTPFLPWRSPPVPAARSVLW